MPSSLAAASTALTHMPLASSARATLDENGGEANCCEHHCRVGPLNESPPCRERETLFVRATAASAGPDVRSNTCLVSGDDDSGFSSVTPQSIHSSPRYWRERKRRRCIAASSWMATAALLVAALLIVAPSPYCMAFSPSSAIGISAQTRPNLTQLHSSVRKRSGKHDVSVARAKRAVSVPPTPHDHKLEQHQLQRKQSLIEIQMLREQQKKRRSKNVFEQFTPEYVRSPFDVDVLPRNGEREANGNADEKANGKSKQQQKHLTQRLKTLLQNDEGEQDYFADDSPEAANQVADIKIYGKLSEEARRKATEAVKEVKHKTRKGKRGDDELGEVQVLPVQSKRKSKVRATVKETGSDSINTYIKSLGQHELLNKADEVLLATQVRLLIGLEETRKMLEQKQLG